MSFLENIDVPERRKDRRHCERCGTSAATCRSIAWMLAHNCCAVCPGNHDTEED